MSRKGLLLLLGLLMAAALLVPGCAEKEVKEAVEGALLGEVVFELVDSPAEAVLQLQSGDIDVYAFDITDPDLFDQIASDENLSYGFCYGSYSDIRFNTWGKEFDDGRLNPFYSARIREAMNYLIDRDWVVDEYLGGLGAPKWTFLATKFPDNAIRYPDMVKEIEEFYAHDEAKAAEIVAEEMEKLGAAQEDGKWMYKGEEVELIALIRSDLPPYPEAGNYFAGLLEDLGFKIEYKILAGSEANPIWTGTEPKEGQWNFYTGGWSSPVIQRCEAHTFDQFYTHRVMPFPVFQILKEPLESDFPELDEVSRKLRQKDFTTMEEREELFSTGLWEAMKFSNQIWVCDQAGVYPYRADVKTAVDLGGGIGDPAWVFTTFRHKDGVPQFGERLKFGVPNMMVDPWNPVEGSAFVYDNLINRRALGDEGYLPDPRDGIYWAKRAEKAEVTVQTGLPVDVTLDWASLAFADEIEVPDDAWADWDAAAQKFITVEEKFPEGVTALRKSVVYYPDDLFESLLHDGSNLSIGDFVMAMIVYFDRGKEASPIFDESYADLLEADLEMLKGIRIVSEQPLVIETYSDVWYLDAEWNVTTWWPDYGTYDWSGFWHMISVGLLAESAKDLTFSKDKSVELGVDQMDYTKGPSLEILEQHMNKAAGDNFIPYEPTLGDYITAEEATARWSNIQAFYEERGHFWVGAGPYVIKEVHPVEKIAVLEGFAGYREPADRWFFFLEPLAIE